MTRTINYYQNGVEARGERALFRERRVIVLGCNHQRSASDAIEPVGCFPLLKRSCHGKIGACGHSGDTGRGSIA
jgi:hypothetical protein